MTPEQITTSDVMTTAQQGAARWFARHRSGTMSAQELRELDVWLSQDRANHAAFEHLSRLWTGAEVVRADPEVMGMREAARRAQAIRRWRNVAAMAACFLVVCLVGAGVSNWMLAGRESSPSVVAMAEHQEFRTRVGQTVTVNLTDGSEVTLDTNTVLRTRTTWNRRYVELERGRAFFKVARDPTRPFVVLAKGRTVTALGTAFEVWVEEDKFEVTLVSGRVRVRENLSTQAGQAALRPVTEMAPGAKLTADDDEPRWDVVKVDVEKETSWVDGLLRFRDEPLANVAAELNRYSRKKVVIHDAAIAARPVQGAFEAGDVEEFVRAVEAYNLARVASESPTEIVLVAPERPLARAPSRSPGAEQ